jgi:hypothetical protein
LLDYHSNQMTLDADHCLLVTIVVASLFSGHLRPRGGKGSDAWTSAHGIDLCYRGGFFHGRSSRAAVSLSSVCDKVVVRAFLHKRPATAKSAAQTHGLACCSVGGEGDGREIEPGTEAGTV